MMKRRKGETLAEILMALLVFGIIMGGVSDFIANHTTLVARIKTRDKFIECAEKLIERNLIASLDKNVTAGMNPYPEVPGSKDYVKILEEQIVSFDWNYTTKLLTVGNATISLDFALN